MATLSKKAAAECFGTFVLVFIAVGTAVVTGANVIATAAAFGLVIVAMAYTIGNISGCHINPAVSLGVWSSQVLTGKKDFGAKEFFVFVIAQVIGATTGAALLYWILTLTSFDFSKFGVWGTNAVAGTGTNGIVGSLLLEIILTMIFVYVILVVCNTQNTQTKAGILIGSALALVNLIGINLTGTSVNPARTLGPALMRMVFDTGNSASQAITQYWVFLIATLVGGVVAAIMYWVLHVKEMQKA
jgi:aquaporin Z